MRVFFNAWFDGGIHPKDVEVELVFSKPDIDGNNISGVFRHAGGKDLPLNQETKISSILSPRVNVEHADDTEWAVVDFQLAYDPCQCQTPSMFYIAFRPRTVTDVKLKIRTIEIQKDLNTLSYEDTTFLHFSDGKPGNFIFRNIDGMVDKYEDELEWYDRNLNKYNNPINKGKLTFVKVMKYAANYGTGGLLNGDLFDVSEFLRENQLPLWNNKIMLPSDSAQSEKWGAAITKSAKNVVAKQFDFLNVMLDITEKPVPPQVPVGTFTEGVIDGTLEKVDPKWSKPLFVPGVVGTAAFPDAAFLNSFNYPAYNEVVGLFALLEYPSFKTTEFKQNCTYEEKEAYYLDHQHYDNEGNPYYPKRGTKGKVYQNIKADLQVNSPLKYALNPALDFDLNKTKIMGALKIELKGDFGYQDKWILERKLKNSNFKINQFFDDKNGKIITEIISEFYNIETIQNVIFSLNFDVIGERLFFEEWPENELIGEQSLYCGNPYLNIEIESVQFKIAADMYFHQKGWNGDQVNTFQVFTYELWHSKNGGSFESNNIDNGGVTMGNSSFVNYQPGIMEINSIVQPTDPIVWNVSGNNIYVKGEDIRLKNTVGPAEGYNLIIEGMSIEIEKDAVIELNTELISKFFYDYPKVEPIMGTADELGNYCDKDGGAYKANIYLNTKKEMSSNWGNSTTIKDQFEVDTKISVYPNPVNQEVNVKVISGELTSCTIKVLSITGQTLIEERVNEDLVNGFAIGVEHLTNGYYILELFSDDGYRVQKKFVVQH